MWAREVECSTITGFFFVCSVALMWAHFKSRAKNLKVMSFAYLMRVWGGKFVSHWPPRG